MAYRLADTAAARRDLQALPRDILIRVEAHIQALAENPRPRGVERVQGTQGGLACGWETIGSSIPLTMPIKW